MIISDCQGISKQTNIKELTQVNQETVEDTGRLLTIKEAGEILGVGRSTVYKLIEDGRLRSVKIGAARRIWDQDIKRFLFSLTREDIKVIV